MSASAYNDASERHQDSDGHAGLVVLRLPEEPNQTESPAVVGVSTRLARAIKASPISLPRHRLPTEPWWLRRGTPPYLLVGDVSAFALATLLAGSATADSVHLLGLAVTVVVFGLAGLYQSRLGLSLLDDLPSIVAAVTVGYALDTTLLALFDFGFEPQRQLLHAVTLLVVVAAFRWAGYAVVRQARRRGVVSHRTVIVGTGQVGTRLALTLLERREYGLTPIGFVECTPSLIDTSLLALPVLGTYDQLETVVRRHAIRDVIVAFGTGDDADLVDVLTTCDRLDVEVFLVPRLLELHSAKRGTDDIWGVPVIRRRLATYRSPSWKIKRLIDILICSFALIFLSPVFALCALAVRLEGGPGVIFRQQRVGMDGRAFEILKFRSLKPVDDGESQTNWNIKCDDRLGTVGRFLRATSMDELPQLWNILRGDMSLVGPRPERQFFVDHFSTHIPRYMARHRVPAGLTGWSQAHGLRGDTSIHDRARFDNFYVENWSLWLDFKIMIMTIGQVLMRKGG